MLMPDLVGWLATAIFAVSYFCKRTTMLRRVQGIAALAWAMDSCRASAMRRAICAVWFRPPAE